MAKAAIQFDAVSADRSALSLLLFVNHDTRWQFADLRETLTGMFRAANGERFQTMPHISDRWIGETMLRIDLFACISARDLRVDR